MPPTASQACSLLTMTRIRITRMRILLRRRTQIRWIKTQGTVGRTCRNDISIISMLNIVQNSPCHDEAHIYALSIGGGVSCTDQQQTCADVDNRKIKMQWVEHRHKHVLLERKETCLATPIGKLESMLSADQRSRPPCSQQFSSA